MMKYIFKYTALLFTVTILLSSCGEAEKQLFDDKDAFIAFDESSISVDENGYQEIKVPLHIAKTVAQGSVSFIVDTEDIDNPAIEGEDFNFTTNEKRVIFNGEYTEYIRFKTIDNDVRDGAKQFRISLVSEDGQTNIGMANGASVTFLVTINDDEHPLAAFFGTFELYETSIEPEEYTYEVTLSGHADPDKAVLNGLWGVPQDLVLQFNYETNEVKILANQTFYEVNVGIPLDFTVFGWRWIDENALKIQSEAETIGTFNLETGVIEFPDGYLLKCSGPEGSQYVGQAWLWTIQDYCIMTHK